MSDKQPIYIMPENVQRTLGRDAQRNNILAAKIVADCVKTTLGPKGMDKMLVDSTGNIVITNDGVTILREMEIEHPAEKILNEIAIKSDSVSDLVMKYVAMTAMTGKAAENDKEKLANIIVGAIR